MRTALIDLCPACKKLIQGLMVVTVQRPFSHTRQVAPICTHLTHRLTYMRVCLAPNSITSRISIGSTVFAGLIQTCNQRIDRQTHRLHYVATYVRIVNSLHLPFSLRNFCSVGDTGKVATGIGSLLAVAITARQIAL